ncbi:MAG: hypothetical protein V7L11_06430 [Nostoc sp.]
MLAFSQLFGSVGAAFEITAILTVIVLAFLVRKHGSTFYWTLGGAIVLVLAFVSWIVFVAPMNAQSQDEGCLVILSLITAACASR